MRPRLTEVILILALTSTIGVGAREAKAGGFNVNLLTNGDAESGTFVTVIGGFDIYSTPGWTTQSGAFEAELYSQGVPPNIGTYSPGPPDRGNLLFYGGDAALSVATQLIDISANASTIDTGSVLVDVNGWLGGFSNQDDDSTLSATFLDASGNSLGSVSIGPVTAADRGDVSGLLFQEADASLPIGTRMIEATLTMTRFEGTFNNGAADNLSISLTSVPEPASLLLAGISTSLGLAYYLARRRKSSRHV